MHLNFSKFFIFSLVVCASFGSSLSRADFIQCDKEEGCQDSVGQVLVRSDADDGTWEICTGFLIGPRLVMTNSHCIPKKMRESAQNCSDSMVMVFPGTNEHKELNLLCDKLVYASPYEKPGFSDYAFFTLEKAPGIKPIEIDQGGFFDRMESKIVKINPTLKKGLKGKGHHTGQMETKYCRVLFGSLNYVLAENNSSEVLLTNCGIVHGNSGSPILDRRGKARGIVSAYLWTERNLQEDKVFQSEGFSLSSVEKEASLGENFSCIKFPDSEGVFNGDPAEVPKSCKTQYTKSDLTKYLNEKAQDINEDLENRFSKWNTFKNAFVRWGFFDVTEDNADPSVIEVVGLPKCFTNPKAWVGRFKNGWWKVLSEIYPKQVKIGLGFPVWTIHKKFDEYRVPKHDVSSRLLHGSMYFDPNVLMKNGKADVYLELEDKGKRESTHLTLPVCSDSESK